MIRLFVIKCYYQLQFIAMQIFTQVRSCLICHPFVTTFQKTKLVQCVALHFLNVYMYLDISHSRDSKRVFIVNLKLNSKWMCVYVCV